MALTTLRDLLQVFAYAAGAIAAIFSMLQYRRNSKRERAKWLFELYERFYERPELKEMRALIEDGRTEFARDESDTGRLQKLDDYLNFFEFTAFLYKRRELCLGEIRDMFEYPLRKVAADAFIRAYVEKKEYGYEGVRELLRVMGYSRS